MTARRDPDGLIRAFLEEGQTQLPDRSFDAVRDAIDRTRQRTGLGPWRTQPMFNTFRPAPLIAGLAAIAVVALVIARAPADRPGASAVPSAAPSSSAAGTPAASGSPDSAYLDYVWPGPLQAGTYATPFSWAIPFELAFTVPAGWNAYDIEVTRGNRLSVSVQLVENTYIDPCDVTTFRDPPIGPTVADLVASFALVERVDWNTARPVSRSGFSGQVLDYAVATPCAGAAEGRMWSHPEDQIVPGHLGPPWWPTRPGNHRLEVLDVNGVRLVIDATAGENPSEADQAELDNVLASLRILARPPAFSLGPCTTELRSAATGELLQPPYRVTMDGERHELNGVHPEPPTTALPNAQVDFMIDGIPGGTNPPGERPSATVIPPLDSMTAGFGTLMPAGGSYIGSWVMDAPGTWWVGYDLPAGCSALFEVEATPPNG
jgi:hypothetical protein